MFKSLFSKFLTAFILIITICLSMLLIIVYGIVNNYAADVKMDSARQVATAVRDYLQEDFSQKDLQEEAAREEIGWMLRLAATSTDQMVIILTDADGVPVVTESNFEMDIPSDFKVPDNVLSMLRNGTEITNAAYFQVLLRENQLAYAVPIMQEGQMKAAVLVTSPSDRWTGLLNVMSHTIVMACLWIMLAALIAVYFISERVSAPLKEMRRAAKDFAKGDFDRRVVVQGSDEVAELGIAFNQMAQSLENLEKTRNSFMANVSHDLRSPMTTIAGFIDAIRDGVIPPEKQDHYLEIVSGEVHRLSRLVSDLLDVTRIQAGERKFMMKPFDVCEMGRQILISLEQQIDAKGLRVEFVCDEDSMMALADYDAIYQTFYNICDNAVKFSCDGGIFRVSIGRLTDKNQKNKLQVSIYNQGQGISEDDLPLVFERFYKGDKSRGLDRRGTGLGLYICKTIITAHGEEIWATSIEGKDCQFSFTLTEQVL
ncbi:MAG: HAMP domain-containing histidine kinase [Ruminococcaceae bacterium]|nr:HAMP domain-containing histidine kinase [Oscillospiraceae bacterium]